jgi:hypothetical protein
MRPELKEDIHVTMTLALGGLLSLLESSVLEDNVGFMSKTTWEVIDWGVLVFHPKYRRCSIRWLSGRRAEGEWASRSLQIL